VVVAAFFGLRYSASRIVLKESLYQMPLLGVWYLVLLAVHHTLCSFFVPDSVSPWSWPQALWRAFWLVLAGAPAFRLFDGGRRWMERGVLPWRRLRMRPANRYRSR